MTVFKDIIQYITLKFPGPFLNYMRAQLETSELKNSSLYEISKLAHAATSLDDLYISLHTNINNLISMISFPIIKSNAVVS